MKNLRKAENLINKYGFEFDKIPKAEIISLIQSEFEYYHENTSEYIRSSSEYLRLLCGYLYCIGDEADIPLIEKVKYKMSMDIGCMIDSEWIESLKNGGIENKYTRSRDELIQDFVNYYTDFKADKY